MTIKGAMSHWTQTDVVQMDELRQDSNRDPILSSISNRIRQNDWSYCSRAEIPFKSLRKSLTVEDGIVCNGDAIVPPPSLRKRFIKAVYDDVHCGALATRNRLRLEAWWPGYCNDVEQYVSQCEGCSKEKSSTLKTEHAWPGENGPWKRIHMDHAMVPNLGLFLVLVDSYSSWPEVFKVTDRTSSTVQRILRCVFARNGVPFTVVCDNAAEYGQLCLGTWLRKIGCTLMKTPPYHPPSNGAAERMVQTIKRGLKSFVPSLGTFDAYLQRLLLSYRTIPHGKRNQSPYELMGRQLRSPLTTAFHTDECLWYVPKEAVPQKAWFVVQQGQNTAHIVRGPHELLTLAHFDQIRKVGESSEEQELDHEDGEDRNDHPPTVDSQPLRRSTRVTKGVPPDRFRFS